MECRRFIEPVGDVHPHRLSGVHLERRPEIGPIDPDCGRFLTGLELADTSFESKIKFATTGSRTAGHQRRYLEGHEIATWTRTPDRL